MPKRKDGALFLVALALFSIVGCSVLTSQSVKGQTERKNVLLIGWDGVQRNHLFEMINRGLLGNLTSFANNRIFNITVMDHDTDTKAGWTQILTGYKWWKTGVFSNVYWFHSIPANYTILERAESYFGGNQVTTGFIIGKLDHMEIQDGTGDTGNGLYTREAIYRNLPSAVDVCTNGAKGANVVGPSMLQFLENNANNHFFAFFHFSDPDTAGHFQGGENSVQYEQAIVRCDNWLGQILNKLNSLNIAQKTLVYVTADHGFDEGGTNHIDAPYVFFATNDTNVNRNGDQVDVAPTVYYGLGMWSEAFAPSLDGYPLQISLPEGVEGRRQNILADLTQPAKATITSPATGAGLLGTVITVKFNASDKYLSTVLFLLDNALKADGPWTWEQDSVVKVNGTYSWDTANLPAGKYTITLLAFDEHGATNNPSTSSFSVASTQRLAVNKLGNGAVNLDKAGPYYFGDTIQLTAFPETGWSFAGWSGALTTTNNPATITMDGDKTVTGAFTQNQYVLTVSTRGNGTINLDKAGPYYYGDNIQLTAVPSKGWNFTGWSGALASVNNPATITILSNNAVTATFTLPLTVTVTPTCIILTRGQTANFSASVSGGNAPYTYQWYVNGVAVTGGTNSTFSLAPEEGEHYNVRLEIADSKGTKTQSNAVTDITVNDAVAEDNVQSLLIMLAAVVSVSVITAGILIYFKKRK